MLRAVSVFALGLGFGLGLGALQGGAARAETPDLPLQLSLNGAQIEISRSDAPTAQIEAPACLPACLLPLTQAEGVATYAEAEVLQFLATSVQDGTGVLIDPRPPERFAALAIPGAVNVPAPALTAENPYLGDILTALGASQIEGGFDFKGAKALVIADEGPWSAEGRVMLDNLLALGYPPEKIAFFRGGLRDWALLGLTVQQAE